MSLPDHSDIPDHDVDLLAERCELGLPTKGGRLNERHLHESERRWSYESVAPAEAETRVHPAIPTEPLPVGIPISWQPTGPELLALGLAVVALICLFVSAAWLVVDAIVSPFFR